MSNVNLVDLAIGKAVRRLRESKEWSEADLVESLGIDEPAIHLVEAGLRRLSAGEIHKVVSVFGVEVAELYRDLGHDVRCL